MVEVVSGGKGKDQFVLPHVDITYGEVARFAAYVHSSNITPGGEMRMALGIPHGQIPHAMDLLKQTMGVMWEVTFTRVEKKDLPKPGW